MIRIINEYLYHTVFDKRSLEFCLGNGIVRDDQGYVYLSAKPIDGYATFKVFVPDYNKLYDWEDFWLDDYGNEIDYEHEYDPNNKYYMYNEDIPNEYINLL